MLHYVNGLNCNNSLSVHFDFAFRGGGSSSSRSAFTGASMRCLATLVLVTKTGIIVFVG